MDRLVLESPAKIGDTLLATPAIRSWKRAHPDAWLTVCCPDHGAAAQVLLHNRYIDALVVVDDDERARLPGRHLRLDAEAALGLGRVHGRSFAWGYGRMLGVEIDGPAYDYTIEPDEREAAERECAALGGGAPVVLVARHSESCTSNDPDIGAPNKCVDNVHWCHVADGLARRGFVPVAIGAARRDRRPALAALARPDLLRPRAATGRGDVRVQRGRAHGRQRHPPSRGGGRRERLRAEHGASARPHRLRARARRATRARGVRSAAPRDRAHAVARRAQPRPVTPATAPVQVANSDSIARRTATASLSSSIATSSQRTVAPAATSFNSATPCASPSGSARCASDCAAGASLPHTV